MFVPSQPFKTGLIFTSEAIEQVTKLIPAVINGIASFLNFYLSQRAPLKSYNYMILKFHNFNLFFDISAVSLKFFLRNFDFVYHFRAALSLWALN